MDRFPSELADILSPRGRAVLEGRDELCGALNKQPFLATSELIDADFAMKAPAMLAAGLERVMFRVERLAPNNDSGDMLPKAGRHTTTPMDPAEAQPAIEAAQACGLLAMLSSSTYLQFCRALTGREMYGPRMMQALCLRPGDYAGPHTDAHFADPSVRDGYTDVHLTFCTPGIKRQLLVYAKDRHFSEVVSLTEGGTVTAYRLPLWHYTTPLEAEPEARRWIVMGTFTDRPLQQ